MPDGSLFLHAESLLGLHATIIIFHRVSIPKICVVGSIRILLKHAVNDVRFAITFDTHNAKD